MLRDWKGHGIGGWGGLIKNDMPKKEVREREKKRKTLVSER
jgi:hypothetical protein